MMANRVNQAIGSLAFGKYPNVRVIGNHASHTAKGNRLSIRYYNINTGHNLTLHPALYPNRE
jgi:hypothetical protein